MGLKEKDIEFVASGQLAAELSSRGARPARPEDIVDKLVQSYINKKYAYVCIETTSSLGGIMWHAVYTISFRFLHAWLA